MKDKGTHEQENKGTIIRKEAKDMGTREHEVKQNARHETENRRTR